MKHPNIFFYRTVDTYYLRKRVERLDDIDRTEIPNPPNLFCLRMKLYQRH